MLGWPSWSKAADLSSVIFGFVGSNPTSSNFYSLHSDTMAEWLRRQIRNLMGSARVGSNPSGVGPDSFDIIDNIAFSCVLFFFFSSNFWSRYVLSRHYNQDNDDHYAGPASLVNNYSCLICNDDL